MKSTSLTPYFFLLPLLILVAVYVVYSVIFTVYVGLLEWDGIGTPDTGKFIGLQNYVELFRSPLFTQAIGNTIVWVVVYMTLPIALGLLIAILVDSRIKGEVVFKTIFFLPLTLAPIVVGVLWKWIYAESFGVLQFSAKSLQIGWLAKMAPYLYEPEIATFFMAVAATWGIVGFNMVIFLAGLRSINPALIDAALVDGAGRLNVFRHITIPSLIPFFTIVFAMNLINALRIFDLIWMLTMGGPYRSTSTLAVIMYQESFTYYRMGYGSAVCMVLFVLVAVPTTLYILWMRRQEVKVY